MNSDSGQDYIGFVFSYQSNRKFYVVLWRHSNYNYNSYGGIKGIQIKVAFIFLYRTNNIEEGLVKKII